MLMRACRARRFDIYAIDAMLPVYCSLFIDATASAAMPLRLMPLLLRFFFYADAG